MFEGLSENQLAMAKHAFGYDSRTPGFRSHYCTELEDPDMKRLVEAKVFVGPSGMDIVAPGFGMYYLTGGAMANLRELKEKKVAEPKMKKIKTAPTFTRVSNKYLKKNVGNRILMARTLMDVTQIQTSKALGISQSKLSKVEQGTSGLSADQLYHASQFFDRPVAWFFKEMES